MMFAAGFRIQALMLVVGALIGMTVSGSHARRTAHRCVVPSVKHERLRTAERKLRAARCAVGRIRGPRTGVVKLEIPRAGRHERTHARITLTLKSRPKGKKPTTIVTGKPKGATVSPPTATPSATTGQPLGIPGTWQLVLDSEFNTASLNTSLWRTGWYGAGVTSPVNSDQPDCYSPSNVTFPGDGTMHLSVTAVPSVCGGVTLPYTGSLVSTNPEGNSGGGFEFTYGVMEARVYLPADGNQIANWPAVWSTGQSWPTDGEDDVLEGYRGFIRSTFHDPLGMSTFIDTKIAPGWHTVSSDWEPGSVTYYYDGVEVATDTTGITGAPMYIVLDNTVLAGQPATTEADSMQVQYVRVWQH